MTERISLAEAYNNKDVVTQIAILKDKLDSIPDADLTNVVLKTGDQVIDGEKTFNDPIVANGGVVFANSGIHVNGTLEVDGDIIQNGSAYETHAEQVFTKNDLIVTREDAIGGIAAGQLSGIRVKKYDGVSDLNLGVDASGTMRVGDVGSEQPLMTRDEVANMTSGNFVLWDGVNDKAITSSLGPNGVIKGSGNIGDDTHPVKIVNGEPVAVSQPVLTGSFTSGNVAVDGTNASLQNVNEPMKFYRVGNLASVSFSLNILSNGDTQSTYRSVPISAIGACPKGVNGMYPLNASVCSVDGSSSGSFPFVYVDLNGTLYLFIRGEALANKVIVGSITYICTD